MSYLRSAVEVINQADSVQLNDTETGFSLELDEKYKNLLLSESVENDVEKNLLRRMLQKIGLTNDVADLREIRKKQRDAFRENTPPIIERLRNLLFDITKNVPFFRNKLSEYNPALLHTIVDFKKIPFMRKRDIRAHFMNGLLLESLDVRGGLEAGSLTIVSTSGSTDDRLQVISRTEIDRLPFGSDDLLGVHIGGKQPDTAFFTTPICSSAVCRLGNASYEERKSKNSPDLYLNTTRNPFAMQEGLIESFCDDIKKFKPLILAANPIYLQCLIRKARELNISLPHIPLIQSGFEFGSQSAIRDIKKAFNTPVLNDYAASEENRLALQCHRGALHIRADVVYVEILNAEGECPPGVVGSVAITTLDSVTPLVRYLIGDAAAWTGKKCDCEFSDWPTIELHGRIKDMIRARGKWVSTLEIDNIIGAPDWLDFYRFIEHEDDVYEMQIIPSLECSPKFEELSEKLELYFDKKNVKFSLVDHFDPLPSMKIGLVQAHASRALEIM